MSYADDMADLAAEHEAKQAAKDKESETFWESIN